MEFNFLFFLLFFADFFCTGIHRRRVTSATAGGIFIGPRTGFHRLQTVEAIPGNVTSFVFSALSSKYDRVGVLLWRFIYVLIWSRRLIIARFSNNFNFLGVKMKLFTVWVDKLRWFSSFIHISEYFRISKKKIHKMLGNSIKIQQKVVVNLHSLD